VKKIRNVLDVRIPLLASPQGGVAAPTNKMPRSFLSWAQTGWFSF
jgi:hypothetical protein